jgi:hypothetical protein
MKVESMDIFSGDFRRQSSQVQQTMNMNINLVGAKAEGDLLQVDFEYVVTYLPGNSFIRLIGKASLRGSESETRKAVQEWMASGRISGEGGELIINAINYGASINSVLISRAVNLVPPIVLPTLTIGDAGTPAESGKLKVPKPSKKK